MDGAGFPPFPPSPPVFQTLFTHRYSAASLHKSLLDLPTLWFYSNSSQYIFFTPKFQHVHSL